MITNIRVELTDDERRVVGRLLHGKDVMATRKDVAMYVHGVLDCVTQAAELDITSPTGKQDMGFLRDTHDDPALEGKPSSYIVGWNKVKFAKRVAG